MQKIKLVVLLALLMPMLAFADSRVAVLDPMQAVVNSNFVQSRQDKLQDELKDKEGRAKKLAGELQALQQDLQQNGMTMSKKEKDQKQDSFTTKNMEFQSLKQMIDKRVKDDQKDVLETIQPKLEQAVEDLAKAKNIDVVVNARAVLYAKPDLDITKAVTDALNKMNIQ
jgi:outer membrane protein